MKNLWIIGVIVIFCSVFAVSCGDDDGTSNGPVADAGDDAGDDAGSECKEYPAGDGQVCAHEVGECMTMDDCGSGYCEVHSVVPWSTDAQCMAPPPAGTTRLTGIVRDFETNEALSGVTAKFYDGASVIILKAAAYDSVPKFNVISGADGRFEYDYEWDVQSGDLGLVSLIREDGYFVTATGFVEPTEDREAPTGSLNHHTMAISECMVETLMGLAAADPVAGKFNPTNFGKVLYNDLIDGEGKPVPVQGATVKGLTGSDLQVYYVNEDMDGLNASATASHGIFIISTSAAKDKVATYRGDTEIGYYESTMGNPPSDIAYIVIVPVYSADDPEAPAINCD
jgi:hypothetical protein